MPQINDKSSGDDRLNGIEISMKPCTGDDGQKFDLITKGKNNDQAGFTLIASSQTFECIDRRAADNHANPGLFACGQLFTVSDILSQSLNLCHQVDEPMAVLQEPLAISSMLLPQTQT